MQIIFNYNYSMFQLGLKQKRTNNNKNLHRSIRAQIKALFYEFSYLFFLFKKIACYEKFFVVVISLFQKKKNIVIIKLYLYIIKNL